NNDRANLVAGESFTDSTPNPTTGVPTQHAFLWDGIMHDIPTLGGSFAFAQCANSRGQVIGQSNLPGDPGCNGSDPFSCNTQAFLWDGGTPNDLRTLGGTFSVAFWLNNAGEAVGGATTTGDQEFQATLWKNGRIRSLKIDDDCFSMAWSMNSRGEVVGQSFN